LEAQALRYSACIRAHGEPTFPDPTIGSNGLPLWSMNALYIDPQSTQFQAAKSACKSELPNLGAPPTQQDEVSAALNYTACMRSHGEPDFPDPNGHGVIQITNPAGVLDPNSPQFQKAQTACQSLNTGFDDEVPSSSRSGS
jgi:hypothetical protein